MPCPHGYDKVQNCHICSPHSMPLPPPLPTRTKRDQIGMAPPSREVAVAAADEAAAIDARIIKLCLAASTIPELRNKILGALKDPSKIRDLPPGEITTSVEIWHERNCGENIGERARSVRAAERLQGPPRTSRSAAGTNFAGNFGAICSKIIFAWLRVQRVVNADLSIKPKSKFYQYASVERLGLSAGYTPEIWHQSWMRAMATLFPPEIANVSFSWTCENLFGAQAVFAIECCSWNGFPKQLAKIISALEAKSRKGLCFVSSYKINHAVGVTIKPHMENGYISVRILDPNCLFGEASIALPLSPATENWEARLSELIQTVGLNTSNYPNLENIDLTVVCYEDTHDASDTFSIMTNSDTELRTFGEQLCVSFSYNALQNIGGRSSVFLQHAFRLLSYVSPQNLVSIRGHDNSTLLYLAAQNGYIEVVEFFLKIMEENKMVCGPLLEPRSSRENVTPFFIAAQKGWDAIIALFLKFASKHKEFASRMLAIRTDFITPLSKAAEKNHHVVVKLILKFADENMEYAGLILEACNGVTPLFFGAQEGNSMVVEEFLIFAEKRLEFAPTVLAVRPSDSVSPLLIAVQVKMLLVVQQFLEFVAKRENFASLILIASKPSGLTPFLLALRNKYVECVELFLKFAVKHRNLAPIICQPHGTEDPLEQAKSLNNEEINSLIKQLKR